MIEAKYKRVDLELCMIGHAKYAEIGKDIVCAGASALFFAALSELRSRGFKYLADLGDGYAYLKASPSAEERHTCLAIFDTVVAGLENIAQQYPDYIRLVKEDNTNGIDC